MPYCKHVCIHSNVRQSIAYILDPEKTEGGLLTTSLNCMTDAKFGSDQMRLVYDRYAKDTFNTPPPARGKGTVKAIHYIMSFADSEKVTPELAHKIAKAFVKKTFGLDVQVVIATHVDKDHIHNHIVLNSYSLTGQKFYANRDSLRHIREYANGVCRALGVTPELNFENKGTSISHYEWENKKRGTSWKEKIRNEIDGLIGSVKSLDELLQELKDRGYEIKRGAYITLKAPGQEHGIRTKTLGEDYTEDRLNERIRSREVGSGYTTSQNDTTDLSEAYSAILKDVRILAYQHKKVPRKRIERNAYSVDNDLDVFRLSAQLSVISQDKIYSIHDLEGRIKKIQADYEKERQEVNRQINEYNRLLSLQNQAEDYYALMKKGELSEAEKVKITVHRQALRDNGILHPADVDSLRVKVDSLYKKATASKQELEGRRQRYAVYKDIRETYYEISKGGYIERMVEEERQRREQEKKKKKRGR